ncbi:MAG: ABC transporter ATP-binding protein [Oligoflexia bacterium]|nr:ABC transporter ATP-binding protein [Oligoflexia bacterium]
MLEISNLNKTYPNGVQALNNVSLKIDKGMFGLLGPNGAGKSSLMRTIATLQDPDSGTINFNEIDVITQKEQIRSLLGYLPQEFGVYPTSSAEELLNHLALLKGIADGKERKNMVTNLLELTNLSIHKKKKLGGFSGGMKQRFGIAQALLANPQIIIVDEPTAGLDPEERDRFHNLLCQIGENVTVILSTHIVSDVSVLCKDMAIMDNGRVLVQISPSMAIEKLKGKIWKKIFDKNDCQQTSKYKIISSRLIHGKLMLHAYSESLPDNGFELDVPDLEDVYFAYIKKIIEVR